MNEPLKKRRNQDLTLIEFPIVIAIALPNFLDIDGQPSFVRFPPN